VASSTAIQASVLATPRFGIHEVGRPETIVEGDVVSPLRRDVEMLLANDQGAPDQVHVGVGDDLLVERRGCGARVDGHDQRDKTGTGRWPDRGLRDVL
jgi:hypothetical protein